MSDTTTPENAAIAAAVATPATEQTPAIAAAVAATTAPATPQEPVQGNATVAISDQATAVAADSNVTLKLEPEQVGQPVINLTSAQIMDLAKAIKPVEVTETTITAPAAETPATPSDNTAVTPVAGATVVNATAPDGTAVKGAGAFAATVPTGLLASLAAKPTSLKEQAEKGSSLGIAV